MHACIVAKQSCRLPNVSMIGAHLAHVYGSGRRRRRGLRVGRDNGAHVRGTGPSVRLHPPSACQKLTFLPRRRAGYNTNHRERGLVTPASSTAERRRVPFAATAGACTLIASICLTTPTHVPKASAPRDAGDGPWVSLGKRAEKHARGLRCLPRSYIDGGHPSFRRDPLSARLLN